MRWLMITGRRRARVSMLGRRARPRPRRRPSRRLRQPLVAHVAARRLEAGVMNPLLDGLRTDTERRPSTRYDVLLEHHAAEIVRAEAERDLTDRRALRDPRSAHVIDVVEHEPRDRLRA